METVQYRLAIDGDSLEKYYWDLFIQNYFPQYEFFWQKSVVPLTNRPLNIHFKTDTELIKDGKTTKDLHIAQLSYSAMINLGRCFDIINILKSRQKNIIEQRDLLTEGFARLIGAQDNVFELLERKNNPVYDAFSSKSSERARKKWQEDHEYPLNPIRRYRNNLIHGGIHTAITGIGNEIWFIKIGIEEKYLDWRIVTSHCGKNEVEFAKVKKDFISPSEVLEEAFLETTKYCENQLENYKN